jgi:hypothetical protein
MFSLPGTIALIAFFVVRVQEIVPALHGITVPHLIVLGLLGLVIDARLGRVSLHRSPFLTTCLLFMIWSIAVAAAQLRYGIEVSVWITLGSSYCLFFLIAYGAQSLRAIRAVSWALVLCVLFATGVAVHQGTQPSICMVTSAEGLKRAPGPEQTCEKRSECDLSTQDPNADLDPDSDTECEREGLFGTTSVFGRVRYRGVLEDPNELAWVVSMTLPLLLWLVDAWPLSIKVPTLLVVFALDAACVIMTKSRSGQLSFLLVLALLAWRRLGWRGVMAGAVLGLPVLFLGGRSGQGADESSIERLGCWDAGIRMWREHPILGVGTLQFAENYYLTAHNSFVLTLAEGGPLLLFGWTALFWQLYRSRAVIAEQLADAGGQRLPTFLIGMLGIATAPTIVSSFFLSIAYKPVLWASFGLFAATEGKICAKLETRVPGAGGRDAFGIVTVSVAIIGTIFVYLKIRGVD